MIPASFPEVDPEPHSYKKYMIGKYLPFHALLMLGTSVNYQESLIFRVE